MADATWKKKEQAAQTSNLQKKAHHTARDNHGTMQGIVARRAFKATAPASVCTKAVSERANVDVAK